MERLRGFSELREDLTRLASYHSARKRGMSADEAAEHVSAHHFDYGDLTETERAVFRRSRLQATGVLTQPGCFATTEKARQESGRAGGFDPDWAKALRKYRAGHRRVHRRPAARAVRCPGRAAQPEVGGARPAPSRGR